MGTPHLFGIEHIGSILDFLSYGFAEWFNMVFRKNYSFDI